MNGKRIMLVDDGPIGTHGGNLARLLEQHGIQVMTVGVPPAPRTPEPGALDFIVLPEADRMAIEAAEAKRQRRAARRR